MHVEFGRLLDAAALDSDLRDAIDTLLDRTRTGAERDAGPRLPEVHDFIEAELERQEGAQFPESTAEAGIEPLNTFFRAVLRRFSPA